MRGSSIVSPRLLSSAVTAARSAVQRHLEIETPVDDEGLDRGNAIDRRRLLVLDRRGDLLERRPAVLEVIEASSKLKRLLLLIKKLRYTGYIVNVTTKNRQYHPFG
ncbi:MAG TPA: hypothetical protein VLR45_06005 [Desulfoprunum sp.]|nr:hypothetical protein [Desulfoprunum sp.]